jgi:hypothetical protein
LMQEFQVLAQPWWVNLILLVPTVLFGVWRKQGPRLKWRQLVFVAIFAAAFGFVEAAVVVYLRAAVGMLPGYLGTLTEVRRASRSYSQVASLGMIPKSLLTVEMFREAATMMMLAAVALLTASKSREWWGAFLGAFAIWDIAYYACLWATVRWPASFTDLDVLFLIPLPWIAPVWFPVLVSSLTLVVIVMSNRAPARPAEKKAAISLRA